MLKSIWRRARHDPSTLIAATGLGAVVAIAFWFAPSALIDPLFLARGLLAGAAAGAVVIGFLVLLVMLDRAADERRRRARSAMVADHDAPPLRAHDLHPDAPPRRPLSAADLETLEPVKWPAFRTSADDDVLELTRPHIVPNRDERPTLRELLTRLELDVERRAAAWPNPSNAPPPVPDQILRDALDDMRRTA